MNISRHSLTYLCHNSFTHMIMMLLLQKEIIHHMVMYYLPLCLPYKKSLKFLNEIKCFFYLFSLRTGFYYFASFYIISLVFLKIFENQYHKSQTLFLEKSQHLTTNIVSVYSTNSCWFFRNPDINCKNLPCFPSQIWQGSGRQRENFETEIVSDELR